MADKITQLQRELGTIIKGKKEVTDKIIMAVLARGHVLLEDVPGVGKTTTALALCRLMGMDFNRIQFTPDVVPSDVTGFTMYEKQTGKFIYRPGAVMCNMLLADEINRTSSKTQSALLEAMEELQVTVDYALYERASLLIDAAGAKQAPPEFTDRVTLRWQMPEHTEAPLLEQLRELTRGSAQVTVSDPFYAPF